MMMILFLFLFFFLWGDTLQKAYTAPSFEVGSGSNLAGLFIM